MFRVAFLASFLSIAACISSPEVTLVDDTREAHLSPDGSAEGIALVEEISVDGGAPPHPEGDAGGDEPEAGAGSNGDDDENDDTPGKGKGKGKGKGPKKSA